MNDSQTSSNNLNHAISQRTDSYWTPPQSFSVNSEEAGIFLVDNIAFARQRQTPTPFSKIPMNTDETLALSGWDDDINPDTRNENFMDNNDNNSNFGYSSDVNTINTYDDDTASVTTCSTTTTTTTSSDYPPVVHVTLADLIKIQERRQSMQDNINNYNMTIDKTSSINKSKPKTVNFKDEIVESPVVSSRNSVDLSPPSVISNDSSTIKDNNSNSSSHKEGISITPSLGPKISPEEFESARHSKQKVLRGWVKCLWPQPRLPTTRQLVNRLTSRSLLKRNLNPLTVGIITMKSTPMILTAIVKGTNHINSEIGKDGQIKFIGNPLIIKSYYDPREYILLHCPTYHNPPYYNGDPRIPWTEHFLLNKVLPRLADEATRIQNEVGLYLTIRETLLRGFEQYALYECRLCNTLNDNRTFTYEGVYEHLGNWHNIKNVHDEDMITINLKSYIGVFYRNLPPNIVCEKYTQV